MHHDRSVALKNQNKRSRHKQTYLTYSSRNVDERIAEKSSNIENHIKFGVGNDTERIKWYAIQLMIHDNIDIAKFESNNLHVEKP